MSDNDRRAVTAIAVCITSIIITLICWPILNSYFNRNKPPTPPEKSKYEICIENGGEFTAQGDGQADDFSCTGTTFIKR